MSTLNNFTDISLNSLRNNDEEKKQTVKVFDEKNYLDVKLGKNETKKELKIRLLPIDGDSPFVSVHFHTLKVPKEISSSGWKAYVCLEKNKDIDHEKFGNKCPFCELNRMAYNNFSKETDPIKKDNYMRISLANKSREAKIVKCIERGKENEGVKFWKFNVRNDKTDPYNTIIELANTRNQEAIESGIAEGQNILSLLKEHGGRDLKVTITEGNAAPQVIDISMPTSLSNDPNQMLEWINDPKKWQDVFTCKSYEYLQLVAEQKIPWYDKSQGKWIDKAEFDKREKGELDDVNEKIKQAEQTLTNNNITKPSDEASDFMKNISVGDDDELPF